MTFICLALECFWFSKASDLTSGNMYANLEPIQEFSSCSDAIFAEAIQLTKETKNLDYVSPLMVISISLGCIELILVVFMLLLNLWLEDLWKKKREED